MNRRSKGRIAASVAIIAALVSHLALVLAAPAEWIQVLTLPTTAIGLIGWFALTRASLAPPVEPVANHPSLALNTTADEARTLEEDLEDLEPVKPLADLSITSLELDILVEEVAEFDVEEDLVAAAEARESTTLESTLQRLRQVEKFLEVVLDKMPSGVVTTDMEGTILSVNEGVRQLFGHDEAELVGLSLKILVPGIFGTDNHAAIERRIASMSSDDLPVCFRTHGLRADYNTVPIECSSLTDEESGTVTWLLEPTIKTPACTPQLKKPQHALDSTARYDEDFSMPPGTLPGDSSPPGTLNPMRDREFVRHLDQTVRPAFYQRADSAALVPELIPVGPKKESERPTADGLFESRLQVKAGAAARTPGERAVMNLLNGKRTVKEVFEVSPLPPVETRMVLLGLLQRQVVVG